jgi:flagella basal body P-ring formation protein FlgA
VQMFSFTAMAPKLAIVLAIAAVFVVAAGASAEDWGLSIKTSACAQGSKILLGEIATPYGPIPAGTWEKLARMELWSSPEREGRSEAFSRRKIAELLHEHLGELAVRCSIPSGLTVQRGGALLDKQALLARVEEYLRPKLALMGGRAELAGFNAPEVVSLGEGYARLEIELLDKLAAGRVNLRIKAVAGDGRLVRQVAANVFVDHWVAVACASRPVNPGEVIVPDMVTFREKNLAYFRGTPWDGKGGSWQVKRPVGAEQPFNLDILEPVPLVVKGSTVNLVYQGRHVQLAIQAEAMQAGGLGETIPVRNIHSGKLVQAVVMSKDTVAVR